MKKFLIYTIITAMTLTNSLSAFAIQNVNNSNKTDVIEKKKKNDEHKIKPNPNKISYVNIDWWCGFNDEILNDYIVRAIEHNKDLEMATLTIDEYYQYVKAQQANEMPTIQAGFAPIYGKILGDTAGTFGLPIIASYELDLFGKNHNKTTSMKKTYEASILDEQAAYISIASAVGTTYVDIVKNDALIDLQQDIVKLRKEIFEIMSISNAEGIISTSDLVKAHKAYIAGISDLTDLQKDRTKLLHRLAVLVGDSPNNIQEYKRIDYKELAFNGIIPVTVDSNIVMQRPDYMKAEKMLEKAGIDVRVARKEMFPQLSLGGLMFFNNKHLGSLFTTSDMIWAVGGQIMQPIFMGGRLKANLKAKKVVYEKSLKNYEKVNLTSMQEVNDALVSVNMDIEKLQNQKNIQKLEEKDFKLSQAKYQEGIIAKLDLNQMEENLLSVNKMVYKTQFACMVDYINYYKSVAAKA